MVFGGRRDVDEGLLDGIAEMGYALPAVPWFIDQTIGGAVATATHRSSLRTERVANGRVYDCEDGSVTHLPKTTSPRRRRCLTRFARRGRRGT